jgi:hypothetical protein
MSRVSCVARIYSGIPLINNEQCSSLSPGESKTFVREPYRIESKRNFIIHSNLKRGDPAENCHRHSTPS